MKAFYGKGRVWGNSGIFVTEANNIDSARDQIWNATSRREQVSRPNTLHIATPQIFEELEVAIEKGENSKYNKSYDLGYNTTFLEFYEMPQNCYLNRSTTDDE